MALLLPLSIVAADGDEWAGQRQIYKSILRKEAGV
jgi:hypothetical protein